MKTTFPYMVGSNWNEQMKCWDVYLHIGGIKSEKEVKAAAKILAEFAAGDFGSVIDAAKQH